MAKHEQAPTVEAVEEKLGDFAEDLGKIIGSAQAKAAAWLGQRQTILEHLTQVRDKANDLIHSLMGDGAQAAASGAVRRGRRAGSQTAVKRGPGRPPKTAAAADTPTPVRRRRKGGLSEAGRAAISAAQKARWAAIKSGKRK